MNSTKLLVRVIVLLCFISCSSRGNQDASTNSPQDKNNTTVSTANQKENTSVQISSKKEPTELLIWVNNLNVREEPNTKSKVVTQLKENTLVTLTGEKTDYTESLELRGQKFDEPWVKIKTADNKTGWVFLGALKENKISFPHFGEYDLNEWKLVSTKNGDEDEVDEIIYTYKKENSKLEVTERSMGEFGYNNEYLLKDPSDKILKKRTFRFSIDPLELIENVYDYETAKLYTRTQKMNTHYYQLKYEPEMAKGQFNISDISENKIE